MEFRDYNDALGVARDARPDEIKRGYRRLARKFHPDLNREADAENRFKGIREAYEVPKDPEKRAAYDRFGAARRCARRRAGVFSRQLGRGAVIPGSAFPPL